MRGYGYYYLWGFKNKRSYFGENQICGDIGQAVIVINNYISKYTLT